MRQLLAAVAFFASGIAAAQNGVITTQQPFTLPDSSVRKLEKLIPDVRAVLSAVQLFHLTYLSDGLRVKGYMAVPKKPGRYPCIIYNRGGNREFGKITDEGFVRRGLGELARAGYVVVASQYRGNDGGEGVEEFGGRDINDVLNLFPLLASVPAADTSRVGMFGWSRGGMMTYLALTHTTRIKAAVVGSGVADLIGILKTRPEFDTANYPQLIPGYANNKTELLKQRSALYFAEKISKQTPILILQGTADWRVPTDQVLALVARFHEVKQPFRFVLYEGGEHSLNEHRQDYLQQALNWFNNYLRDGKRWPSLEPHGD